MKMRPCKVSLKGALRGFCCFRKVSYVLNFWRRSYECSGKVRKILFYAAGGYI